MSEWWSNYMTLHSFHLMKLLTITFLENIKLYNIFHVTIGKYVSFSSEISLGLWNQIICTVENHNNSIMLIIFILNTTYVKYYVFRRLQWTFHLLLKLNAWYRATHKFFASRLKSTKIQCLMLSTNIEHDIRLSSILFQEIAAWEHNANKF